MQRRKYSHTVAIKTTSDFCLYCGQQLKDWEKIVDHFLPVSYEGIANNTKANLVVTCRECNSIKSDKTFADLQQARDYILSIKRHGKNSKQQYCLTCGCEFWSRTKKKYCSQPCSYTKRRPREEINCKYCGKSFV